MAELWIRAAIIGVVLFLVLGIIFFFFRTVTRPPQVATIAPTPTLQIAPTPLPTPTPLPAAIPTPTPAPPTPAPAVPQIVIIPNNDQPNPPPQIIVIPQGGSAPTPIPDSPPIFIQPPPTAIQQQITSSLFTGQNFVLSYPSNWGVLTCGNSPNFEFDPLSSINHPRVICSVAVLPITVLVDNNTIGCFGNQISLGVVPAIKSVEMIGNTTVYSWCTLTSPVLKVSHRVSISLGSAGSPIDFSSQVETMLSTLRFT